jgi:hypothetical protein
MDLSHNQSGSVRNSVFAVITTYSFKFLDLSRIDLAAFVASRTKQYKVLTTIGGISSLPNTLTIPKIFKLYGPPGSFC